MDSSLPPEFNATGSWPRTLAPVKLNPCNTADQSRCRLLEMNIDAFWLLKLHTGSFGVVNLQPAYPLLLGTLTIVVTVSGLLLLFRAPQRRPEDQG